MHKQFHFLRLIVSSFSSIDNDDDHTLLASTNAYFDRTYSVEQQHYQHKLLHTNILQEKGITGGFVEAAAARALLATANQRPTLSVSSASTPLNSKSPFSFFSRLRNRKKDKIKANVEQKIRAVRAAEVGRKFR